MDKQSLPDGTKVKSLITKTFFFILSLSFAWYLIKSGILDTLVHSLLPVRFLAGFVAGLFYTSFLTSPIAVAMLIVLATDSNPITLALLAGAGSVAGDLIIIKIFRKELSKDINLATHQLHIDIVNKILRKLKLDFVTPLLGAIIVASPLPDELGLMMLGASKLSYHQIAVISYILNTAGILLIVAPINLLS